MDNPNRPAGRITCCNELAEVTATVFGALAPVRRAPAEAPALYKAAVQAGTEAVWIPPLGDAEDARHQELLLLPGIETRIVAVDLSGEVPIIEVEVTDG